MGSRQTIRFTTICFLSLLALAASAQSTSSVLKSGDWFKLSVDKDGVYKIDFNLLKKMGIAPDKIDPKTLKIFGNQGGMLPQQNNAERPYDLQESAIAVIGEDDGKFDGEDYILFYAEGADKATFDINHDIYRYEHNLYSDKNFYFLTYGGTQGKRIQSSEDLGDGFPVIDQYNDYAYHELDNYNDQSSGREWFGERFGISTNEHTVTFTLDGIQNAPIKVVSDVMGQSYTNSSMKLFFNNVSIAEQIFLPIPNTRYGVKGIHRRDTLLVNAQDVSADSKRTQDIKYQFVKGTGSSSAYLDFLLLSFKRSLALYNEQTIFLSSQSLQQPVSQFEIANVSAPSFVWEITEGGNARAQNFRLTETNAAFSTATDRLKKFIVFNSSVPAPNYVERVDNQDLHGTSTPDLVIVCHPLFLSEAQRLADHRSARNNWNVVVTTTTQVYNEFSSGRQDISAIRDFTRHLYTKSPGKLKALLLFGKGSYDYKDRIQDNTNFVPTYESRNSLSPLQTYSSDDFFAFLEPSEGNWGEEPAQDHTLDIGVGRLPAITVAEAKTMVDKIIRYDTDKSLWGYWRKQIVFVADDGNSEDGFTSLHQYQADQLSDFIETDNIGIDPKKLFMGSYVKTVKPNGEFVQKMTDDIVRAFERGSLIINYTGHGSERQWADENVFNDQTITGLKNDRYPFMVTATCEFGRNDNPQVISSAELCVKHPNGGAIGMVTTARPVNATTNFELNEAFYEALLERNGLNYSPLGEVFRKTKNNSTNGVSNRNFILLGDPSLTLALPQNMIVVTSLKTATGSDTLKALSSVTAKGEIRNANGEKLSSFSGKLEATLFDKKTKYVTIGKNNPPFTFSQWDNALFRGQGKVTEGEFEIKFLLPKNIAYPAGQGKFSAYASDPKNSNEAEGAFIDFKIGGTESEVTIDTQSPSVQLFMGDTTFSNGGIVSPNTQLVVRLKDNEGINISNYGIGNSIIASLDDDQASYMLNDYYVSDADDFRSGWIQYPLKNLTPGKHKMTVKAWDVYNNSTEASINFIVTDGEGLRIETFANYPNPFYDHTTLFFTHNRSGDDLQAQLFIHRITGELVRTAEITIPISAYQVDLLELSAPGSADKKLSAGVYLARVVVRSLTNGSKNEQVTKLIVLN